MTRTLYIVAALAGTLSATHAALLWTVVSSVCLASLRPIR